MNDRSKNFGWKTYHVLCYGEAHLDGDGEIVVTGEVGGGVKLKYPTEYKVTKEDVEYAIKETEDGINERIVDPRGFRWFYNFSYGLAFPKEKVQYAMLPDRYWLGKLKDIEEYYYESGGTLKLTFYPGGDNTFPVEVYFEEPMEETHKSGTQGHGYELDFTLVSKRLHWGNKRIFQSAKKYRTRWFAFNSLGVSNFGIGVLQSSPMPLFLMRIRSGTVDAYNAGTTSTTITKSGTDPGNHNLSNGYTGTNNADECDGMQGHGERLFTIDDCTDLLDSDSGIIMFVKFKVSASGQRGYNFHVRDHYYSGQVAGYALLDEIIYFGTIKSFIKLSISGGITRGAIPPGGFLASTWYIGELLYDKVAELLYCKVYDGAGNLLNSNNRLAQGNIVPHATNNKGRIKPPGGETSDGRVQHWLIDNDISREAEFLALMVGE